MRAGFWAMPIRPGASRSGRLRPTRRHCRSIPTNPELLQDYGASLLPLAGRVGDGIAFVEKAMRLNPRHPERYFGNLALNLYLVGRYSDAVSMVRRMSAPRMDHRLYLAAS